MEKDFEITIANSKIKIKKIWFVKKLKENDIYKERIENSFEDYFNFLIDLGQTKKFEELINSSDFLDIYIKVAEFSLDFERAYKNSFK